MEVLFVNKEVISKWRPGLSVPFLSLADCDWNLEHAVIK